MFKSILSILITVFFLIGESVAQSEITGNLKDDIDTPILFANVVLYNESDEMVKVESTDLDGIFLFKNISNGKYYLTSSFIGYEDKRTDMFEINGSNLNLGTLTMATSSVQLDEAVIKAKRALVEVKSDRTVFNVEGTINSVGDNGLGLLRKAPGVLVDNNNNITVLSRSGVLIYVDGKRVPLSGDDLTAYLENLPAEQIDRMDIITNPGAKYEAQGNAGIIDIRLKRDKSHGKNGSINTTLNQGQKFQGNISGSGSYRNKSLSSFISLGYNTGIRFNEMSFNNFQNNLLLKENEYSENDYDGINIRFGTDFYLGKYSTIGFLVSSGINKNANTSTNSIKISKLVSVENIDSILIAKNTATEDRNNTTYNLNYAFDNKNYSLNIDLDYGNFDRESFYKQPNRYYDKTEQILLSENLTEYDTPVNIDIYTGKIDFEKAILGGKLGLGSKISKVSTDNTFLFFDGSGDTRIQNNKRSNEFFYDEKVYAGYVNYAKQLSQKVSFSAGLRVENTDAIGDLKAFLPDLQEDPSVQKYTSYFPSGGITYAMAHDKSFSLNYGRRINRPDYNVLNPFRIQLSELSFFKGNAFLKPEIVNNLELGFTLKYRYNFKLSYSHTSDQITRLIAPDEDDDRAGFISWANLATQKIYGFNVSAPIDVTSWWSSFLNFNAGYLNNQADYGDGAIVDVQAFTYTLFQQQTFTLPKGFIGEVSGYYSGPGVWGGVFKYDPTWSLNLGLQKKFFNDALNVKISVNDIFFQSGWEGESNFNGLRGQGMGVWDSRRATLSLGYNFGNSNVKSRKRKTGIEDESKRVGN